MLTVATASSFVLATLSLLYAALHDVAFRTVPNWIPLTLLLTGSLLRIMSGTLIAGLVAGMLVFLAAVFCWRRGWLGGGDVKLLAGAVVLVPPALAAELLVDIALSGGILALLYVTLARLIVPPSHAPRPPGLLRRIWRTERYRIHRRGPLPYASAIVVGALLVLFKG